MPGLRPADDACAYRLARVSGGSGRVRMPGVQYLAHREGVTKNGGVKVSQKRVVDQEGPGRNPRDAQDPLSRHQGRNLSRSRHAHPPRRWRQTQPLHLTVVDNPAGRQLFAARTMPQRSTVARSSEPNTSRSNAKPIAPITASEASITSALRNSLASKINQPRPQSDAASISAPTTAIQERRKACRSPVMMKGEAPGMITFQNSECSSAPIAPAARSHSGLTARTPDQVLSSIG